MKAYLRVFVNFKQIGWAKLLLMAKFAYNNANNASTGHTAIELNCGYYPCVFFKKDKNLCFRLKTTNKLLAELQKLIIVW